MTNKNKFREVFGVELCYCGIYGKEGCFYIADYDNHGNPGVLTTTKQGAKDWLNAEYKNPYAADSRAGNLIRHNTGHNTDSERHNTFYEHMPEDFMTAIETVMQYCQNEDCDDDCKNCPNPLSVIRCGDKQCTFGETIPPTEQQTGHWIDNRNGTVSCSHCHTWFKKDEQFKFFLSCPYCKADMKEE